MKKRYVLLAVVLLIGVWSAIDSIIASQPKEEKVLVGRPLRDIVSEGDALPKTIVESDNVLGVAGIERKANFSVISDWLDYQSSDGTFFFQYPPEMVVLSRPYGSREIQMMLFGPDQPRLVKRRLVDGLELKLQKDVKEAGIPFDRWVQFTLESGTQIISQEKIQVYGFPAVRIRGVAEDTFDNIYIEISPTELLRIAARYKGKEILEFESIFDKVIETIQITPVDTTKLPSPTSIAPRLSPTVSEIPPGQVEP